MMERKKILLVDDEEIIRTSLAREIRLENYSIDTAADGDEAITRLRLTRYNLVITDLVMPGIDGLGVLQAAKEIAPEICVIIITGYGDMDSAIEALRLGADDFLLKPCGTDELFFRLARCLEKQNLLRQLIEQNLKLKEAETAILQARVDLEKQVKERTIELEETNIALKVLLKKREQDKSTLEQQIVTNITNLIEPYLLKMAESRLNNQQQVLLDILKSNLRELTSQFTNNLSSRLIRLTPAEIQVANLVRQGKRTKEIAEVMNLSPGTISIHRKNIRKKLDLTHKKANLQSILSTY